MTLSFSLALLLSAAPPSTAAPLVVKASPVASPCVAAAIPLFQRNSGRRVTLQTTGIGPAGSGSGADIVVAVQQELTRVIEGGEAEGVETDLARIPWVLSGAGTAAPELRALEQPGTRVRVFGGSLGRYARQSLESLPADRVKTVRTAAGLQPLGAGELALAPLSVAPGGPVSPTAVPPLLVQAVAIRGSRQPEAARELVRFLAAGDGNAAFLACGRSAGR